MIELGEALIGGKEYQKAVCQFEKALAEGSENPKIEAVCHLQLARCYLGLSTSRPTARATYVTTACGHLSMWRTLSPLVKNAFVQRLGKSVEKEVTKRRLPLVFEWPKNASEMPRIDDLIRQVHRWALAVAEGLAGPEATIEDVIKLLVKGDKHITKATFFNWQKDCGQSKE